MTTTAAGMQPGPLQGSVRVPGDEIVSLTALTMGTVARGFTVVSHCSRAPDVVAVRTALGYAGGRVQAWIGDGTTVIVSRAEARGGAPAVALRSPVAAALLIARFAAEGGSFAVDLPYFAQTEPLVEQLRTQGVTIDVVDDRIVRIEGPPTTNESLVLRVVHPPVTVGSLVLANAQPGRRTRIAGRVEGYDHVPRMVERFGGVIRFDADEIDYTADDLSGAEVEVPGDLRAAAFLAAAACVTRDSKLAIEGVAINPTRMGVIDAMRTLGMRIAFERMVEVGYEPIADLRVVESPMHGVVLPADVVGRCGDDWPIVAAVAACATGTTILAGTLPDAPAVVALLRASNVDVGLAPGGLRIVGGSPAAPPESSLRGTDERLAVTAAILAAHSRSACELAATPIEARYPGMAEVWTSVRH
jgi:3-phosphoshikimate 1-carboxyvinyltransferase